MMGKREMTFLVVCVAVVGIGVFLGSCRGRRTDDGKAAAPEAAADGLSREDTRSKRKAAAGRQAGKVRAKTTNGTAAEDREKKKAAVGRSPKAEGKTARDLAAAPRAPLTPEQKEVIEMRGLLDSGDQHGAIRLARDLMDSKDPDIRSKCVTTFGWIGCKALPELTEMLSDTDEDVADDAFYQWKMALDEMTDDKAKAKLIVAASAAMENAENLDALMMAFAGMPFDLAIHSLSTIIEESGKSKNGVAGEVAREMYTHLTGGEIYTGPESARRVIVEDAAKDIAPPAGTAGTDKSAEAAELDQGAAAGGGQDEDAGSSGQVEDKE